MNHTTLNLKSPIPHHGRFLSNPTFPRNPTLTCSPTRRAGSVANGAERSASNRNPICAYFGRYSPLPDDRPRRLAHKNIDVATLGNLCVDIVLNVPELPPPQADGRKAYMERLAASPPDKKYWEAGGNCNMAIAAARLGLHCVTIGHVGSEMYGSFLVDVLQDEGIEMVGMSEDTDFVDNSSASYETLLCWVLVDPLQRHSFCSRADFSKEPAFSWLNKLSGEVKTAIKQSKVLFCNGYGFDELSTGLIDSVIRYAVEVGTAIFFDPGPRGKNLYGGTQDEHSVLNMFLMLSDVLLLTSDEAEKLTRIADPIRAGQQLLKQGKRAKWVIIKMGSKGSILISKSSISCVPGFKVDVVDTVGCGDSFVAAIAYAYINNIPMINTLVIANAIGAATATGCGAGRNVATLEKVKQLIREGNLQDDDTFSPELFHSIFDTQEITILSKKFVNGSKDGLKRVSWQSVFSESLGVLESIPFENKVPS